MGEIRFKIDFDDNDCVSDRQRPNLGLQVHFNTHAARPESGKILGNAQKILKENDFMRKITFFRFSLLLVATLFSLNAFAQDLTQQNLPEGATLRIGQGTVHDLAYSPDGSRLAVASSIGVWLYDTTTYQLTSDTRKYQEVALLTGHTGRVTSVAFQPGWWNAC